MRFVAAVLLVLIAGCATGAPDDPVAPLPVAPAQPNQALDFSACDEMAGRFEIPRDAARPLVPAEFSLVESVNGEAVLFVTAYECAVSHDGGVWQATQELTTAILVEPPEALRIEGYGLLTHAFVVDWYSSSSVALALYQSWQVPVENGAAYDVVTSPALRAARAEADNVAVTSNAPGLIAPYGNGTARMFYEAGASLRFIDVSWAEIPNTAKASGTLEHPSFGTLSSDDMFHAWPYGWTMTAHSP